LRRRTGTAARPAIAICLATLAALTACGGDTDSPSLAEQSQVALAGMTAGVSPFIELVRLQGTQFDNLDAVEFTIQPKAGSLSRPVHVSESLAWLTRQAHYASGAATVEIPIFGLYAGYSNTVDINLRYRDGSTKALTATIPTATYVDPHSIYDHLQIRTSRTTANLGFDYFYLKATGSPVVVDTDGQIRWTGDPTIADAGHSIVDNGSFVIGNSTSLGITYAQFDGTSTQGQVTSPQSPTYTDFHHNIDPGKTGFLAEFDAEKNGGSYIETILAEIDRGGNVLQDWDLGEIIGGYMQSQGDDPDLFVRPGTDWFHMNASTYDPSDDSVIVSSRENFVIKLDYQTKQIKWIFGDPTKYWFTFPSLRAKALTLSSGLYPIGQHGVSVIGPHQLLLFNNGYPSFRQPTGAPSGDSRNYSAVVAYSIDEANRTVTQDWSFDHDQTLQSTICGDAAQASDGSVLIDYAYTVDPATQSTQARLVGLTPSHDVAFDFAFPTSLCSAAFNAQVINLESLSLE
jgi:hypothetical protein